jgi:nicotinamidase-related amidase
MHIIPNLKKLAVAARKHNVPVIYSNDAHLSVYEEVVEIWGKHAIKFKGSRSHTSAQTSTKRLCS